MVAMVSARGRTLPRERRVRRSAARRVDSARRTSHPSPASPADARSKAGGERALPEGRLTANASSDRATVQMPARREVRRVEIIRELI